MARREGGRQQWIEATLELAQMVAEAREQFRANRDFGAWWDSQQFDLGSHDRAALVFLGEHICVAREILINTERTSLEIIAREIRDRLASPRKTTKLEKKEKEEKQRFTSSHYDVADAIIASCGADVPTIKEIEDTYGVKERVAREARTRAEGFQSFPRAMASRTFETVRPSTIFMAAISSAFDTLSPLIE